MFRRFVYFVGDGTAYYDNQSNELLDINTEVVKNFCSLTVNICG